MRRSTAILSTALAAVGALPLTATSASAAEPLPSFVYSSDRDGDHEIYLRKADGPVVQLTRNSADDSWPVWSPDGRKIAFVSDRDGDAEVFVMNADGARVRQLTRNSPSSPEAADAADHSPAWSPDGSALAFVSLRDGGEPEIYRMEADGSEQVRLTRTEAWTSDFAPAWSPNGKYIVFSSDRVNVFNVEVYRMRADGSDVRRLTRTADGIDDDNPEYSPDGTRIAFSSTRVDGRRDLYTMTPSGRDVRPLGGDPALDELTPRWTADGRRVMYYAADVRDTVWIIDADGTDRQQLTGGTASESFPDPHPKR